MSGKLYGLDLVPKDANPTIYNVFQIKGPRRKELFVITEAEKPELPPHYKWYRRIMLMTKSGDIDMF
jgi:hypothetical protein